MISQRKHATTSQQYIQCQYIIGLPIIKQFNSKFASILLMEKSNPTSLSKTEAKKIKTQIKTPQQSSKLKLETIEADKKIYLYEKTKKKKQSNAKSNEQETVHPNPKYQKEQDNTFYIQKIQTRAKFKNSGSFDKLKKGDQTPQKQKHSVNKSKYANHQRYHYQLNLVNSITLKEGQIKDLINKQSQTNKKLQYPQICRCKKSNCQNGYCSCFSQGKPCLGCECNKCNNKQKINNERQLRSKTKEKRENIICKCKKNCTKSYCECRLTGRTCKPQCECNNCENQKVLSFD